MSKSMYIGSLVAVIVVAGGAFFAGLTYARSQLPTRMQLGNGQSAGNAQFSGGMRAGANNGALTVGEIISKDATSITIKMLDGSTRIVLVGMSAQLMKSIPGTISDLIVGAQVTVTGSANNDGSVTAQSVQIGTRSRMPQPPSVPIE